MGINRRTIMSYWNTGSRQIPRFGKMFLRDDKFLLIIKFFHLFDNTTLAPQGNPDYDPCGKFNFLWIMSIRFFVNSIHRTNS